MGFNLALTAGRVNQPAWYDSILPLKIFMREIKGTPYDQVIKTFLDSPALTNAIKEDLAKNQGMGIISAIDPLTPLIEEGFENIDATIQSTLGMFYDEED
jgi:hypothetical protein